MTRKQCKSVTRFLRATAMPEIASASVPLVKPVRQLSFLERLIAICSVLFALYVMKCSLYALIDARTHVLDANICPKPGIPARDGTLLIAVVICALNVAVGCAALCYGVRVMFQWGNAARTRSARGAFAGVNALATLLSVAVYKQALRDDDVSIGSALSKLVSAEESPVANAIFWASWSTVANAFSMALSLAMLYSKSDRVGTAAANVAVMHARDYMLGPTKPAPIRKPKLKGRQ